jgi:hypothetical protein
LDKFDYVLLGFKDDGFCCAQMVSLVGQTSYFFYTSAIIYNGCRRNLCLVFKFKRDWNLSDACSRWVGIHRGFGGEGVGRS